MSGILINGFQQQILAQSLYWERRQCCETSTGTCGTGTHQEDWGPCVAEIQRAYGLPRAEAYCAKFASVILDRAADASGITLPFTKDAGAVALRNKAAKHYRMDKVPAIGSLFYHGSSCANCTGHVGIVVNLHANNAISVLEGNNGDRIGVNRYVAQNGAKGWQSKPARKSQHGTGWDFVHVEEAGGVGTIPLESVGNYMSPQEASVSFGTVLLMLGAALGGYFGYDVLVGDAR